MKSGLVSKAVNNYWRAGVVAEIVLLDVLVLVLCAVDIARYLLTGHSFSAATNVTLEKLREGEGVATAAAVLLFFVIALPMIAALLSSLSVIHNRWPRLFIPRGSRLLTTHMLLSLAISGFTATAIAMEVLAGYENNEIVRYGFRSFWLGVVFLGKPLWASYVSPIIRKFFIRFPHEKEPLGKVAAEVITEDPFEHAA